LAIESEKNTLRKAGDFDGITRLIFEYDIEGKTAIIKEYAGGLFLDCDDPENSPIQARNNLVSVVKNLHNIGIAQFDFCGENVFYNPIDFSVKIVDLGWTICEENVSSDEFKQAMYKDRLQLKSLLDGY